MSDPRTMAMSRITLIGALVNVILCVVKGLAGVLGGSAAMVADAVHSGSDLLSDGVTWVSVRAAAQPPDEDHPYGHGRFETLGAIALAGILLFAGFGIGADAFTRFGTSARPELIAMGAALISIVAKELLFHATVRVGREHNSPLVMANAWHHRSDALSSVAALLGIAGARYGLPVLDPIAAVVVAGLISWTATQVLVRAVREVTDASLEHDLLLELRDGIESIPGVVDLHELRARRMGGRVLVDLHVQVDGGVSVSDGHQVAERVRAYVEGRYPAVTEVLVHIDPEADDDAAVALWRPRDELEGDVRALAAEVAGVRQVSHVVAHYLRGEVAVEVSIVVDPALRVAEASEVAARLRQRALTLDDLHVLDVHLELDPDSHGIVSA